VNLDLMRLRSSRSTKLILVLCRCGAPLQSHRRKELRSNIVHAKNSRSVHQPCDQAGSPRNASVAAIQRCRVFSKRAFSGSSDTSTKFE